MEKYAYPTEAVTIDLGDGRERELRYTLATVRRMRKTFGIPILRGDFFTSLDESVLPEVLFEGLVDKSEITDADQLAELMQTRAVKYLVRQFEAAFSGSFPPQDPNGSSSQPKT